VKFHDGTDLNAQAIKWNMEKVKGGGLFSSSRYWKAFEIIDDYTLRINFTEFRNSIVTAFGQNMCYIVSPPALEKNGIEWMRWNMVGTGPFKQQDFQRDVSLTTVRYDNYWSSGKPYVDKIQYVYVADELTRTALYKSGGADILITVVTEE
jgi:ABC-type transport system substrate-binding protein